MPNDNRKPGADDFLAECQERSNRIAMRLKQLADEPDPEPGDLEARIRHLEARMIVCLEGLTLQSKKTDKLTEIVSAMMYGSSPRRGA